MNAMRRSSRLSSGVVLVALVVASLGCAARETATSSLQEYGLPERPPAIDVTGEWRGEIMWASGGMGTLVVLVLKQEAIKVTGQVVRFPRPNALGPVSGVISGDQVELRGALSASLTVAGDNELRGLIIGAPVYLRRAP